MLNLLQALIAPLFNVIDKVIDNQEQAQRIKLDIQQQILTNQASEFQAAADIIVSEAKGESWLQRNWRPILMLWFAGLIGAHWLGYTAPNIPEDVLVGLLDIVKIGIGGYVIGRSTEKVAKTIAPIIAPKPKKKPEYHFNGD